MRFLASCFMVIAMLVGGTASAANLGVTVTNFSMTPNSTTIAQTDTVTWTRVAGTHNVHNTSTPTRFHNTIGGTWTTYVWPCTTGLGAFPYMCQVHATMTGTVNVARVTVTAANGGENWLTGGAQNITWSSQNLAAGANVIIEINRSFPAGAWETIIASTPNDGTHSWVVAGATGATNRIRVRTVATSGISGAIQDESNANFTISAPPPPVIIVVAPNGGEAWAVGSTQNAEWTTENFAGGSVVIELNRNFPGGAWEPVAAGAPDVGFFDFTISGPASALCRMRMSKLGDPATFDISDAEFSITDVVPLTVIEPNGGENYYIGGSLWTNWSFTPGAPVNIDLNRTFPGGVWEAIDVGVVGPPVNYLATGPASNNCRIRVTDAATGLITDESDADFSISVPTAPTEVVIQTHATDGRLYWPTVPGATQYNIYRSTNASLAEFTDPAGSTADTFFVDPAAVSGNSRLFYQVRAVYP